ncbi:putative holin-like toxin [Longirhabdus pacifica]|nr:putative holin-like toxin [Longirhabdus pacifica]
MDDQQSLYKEVVAMMEVKDSIQLMVMFGMFIISMLTYLKKK